MCKKSEKLECILSQKPALLIGNGINRFTNGDLSSWEAVLEALANRYGLASPPKDGDDMSFTEFFDILGLTMKPSNSYKLKKDVCEDMETWEAADHHRDIVSWAQRHNVPIVTVNFDNTLSSSIETEIEHGEGPSGFTNHYPWSSYYYHKKKIITPRDSFAIWHAHGMISYKHSIRLGLRDYMGSVERARSYVYGGGRSLHNIGKNEHAYWRGKNTWLDVLFFCHLLIFGFNLKKDETFMRWLFLERAKWQKLRPKLKLNTWFLYVKNDFTSKRYFNDLNFKCIRAEDYNNIYKNPGWKT